MNLDRVAVDQNVALDQYQMNVERLGIARKRRAQVGCCNIGQAPLLFACLLRIE
jgi:hypothetical protein